jgi:hypothetical protein
MLSPLAQATVVHKDLNCLTLKGRAYIYTLLMHFLERFYQLNIFVAEAQYIHRAALDLRL